MRLVWGSGPGEAGLSTTAVVACHDCQFWFLVLRILFSVCLDLQLLGTTMF